MENGKWKMWADRGLTPCAAALSVLLCLAAGCQVEEAVIDGFYGGISDVVSAVIAEALLGQAGGG